MPIDNFPEECHHEMRLQPLLDRYTLVTVDWRKGTRKNSMSSDDIQVLPTDALSGLQTLPSKTVRVALTSPPFYLLRRYGTAATWPDGWKANWNMNRIPTTLCVISSMFSMKSGACYATMAAYGSTWRIRSTTSRVRRVQRTLPMAPMGVLCGGKGYAESLRQQPEFFKHYVPSIGHKSEMGVPFRFHLAMTDSEFRRLSERRKARNGSAAVRLLGKIVVRAPNAGGGRKRHAGANA